jgi:hypothetical protein
VTSIGKNTTIQTGHRTWNDYNLSFFNVIRATTFIFIPHTKKKGVLDEPKLQSSTSNGCGTPLANLVLQIWNTVFS